MESPIRYVHAVGHCVDCQEDVKIQIDYKDKQWGSSVPKTCRNKSACISRVLMRDCKFEGGSNE